LIGERRIIIFVSCHDAESCPLAKSCGRLTKKEGPMSTVHVGRGAPSEKYRKLRRLKLIERLFNLPSTVAFHLVLCFVRIFLVAAISMDSMFDDCALPSSVNHSLRSAQDWNRGHTSNRKTILSSSKQAQRSSLELFKYTWNPEFWNYIVVDIICDITSGKMRWYFCSRNTFCFNVYAIREKDFYYHLLSFGK